MRTAKRSKKNKRLKNKTRKTVNRINNRKQAIKANIQKSSKKAKPTIKAINGIITHFQAK